MVERGTEARATTRGGARSNAGRKRNGPKARRSHLPRERFTRLLPAHVTVRVGKHVFNLRSRRSFSIIARAIAAAAQRFGMRILHFAVLGNHMHLVVEAESSACLSRAMQGFSIRVAKKMNALMKKRGRVLGDRYHARVLRDAVDARGVVRYVRNNFRRHMAQVGQIIAATYVDPFSSFASVLALPRPRSWLLGTPSG